MNKFLYILCALFLLCACEDARIPDEEIHCTPAPVQPVVAPLTLSFAVAPHDAEGRDYDRSTRETGQLNDLNIYIYVASADFYYHEYIEGAVSGTRIFIPKGSCRMYFIGNMGCDMGSKTPDQIVTEQIRVSRPSQLDNPTILTAARSFILSDQTTLKISLDRRILKISYNIALDPALAPDACIVSVTPYNCPASSGLFANKPLQAGDPTLEYAYDDFSDRKLRSYSSSYYQFSNPQGVKAGITKPEDRTADKAPACASYFVIRILYKGIYYDYRIYPGAEYAASDFSVSGNKNYQYDITILGTNPSDLRISKTELVFYGGQGPEQVRNIMIWQSGIAYAKLAINTENCDENDEISLSYRMSKGTFKRDWYMQFFPTYNATQYKRFTHNKFVTVHKGNGKSYVYLKFINTDGYDLYQTTDNKFIFTVQDNKGFRADYTISTDPDERL